MAIRTTPLGFKKPDGRELINRMDDHISDNADVAEREIQQALELVKTAVTGPPGRDGSNVLPTDTAIRQAIQDPASQTRTALSATFATPASVSSAVAAGTAPALAARPSNTIVLMGDSLTAGNGGVSTSTPVQPISPAILDGKGIHNWANFFLGKDLAVLGNSGIGGQTSSSIRSRFTTDVLNLNPAIVSILAGTNDPANMDTIGNLTAMYTAATTTGIRVVAQTIPPSANAGATVELRRLKINDWIRNYTRSTPGIILADLAAA